MELGFDRVSREASTLDGGSTSHIVDEALVGEKGVGSPGKKVELFIFRVEIAEEVVSVARVAIPEAKEAFDGPESIEGVHVEVFGEVLLNGLGLLTE